MSPDATRTPLTLVPNRGIQQLVLASHFSEPPHGSMQARANPRVEVLSLWAKRYLEHSLLLEGRPCPIQPSQLRLRRLWEGAIKATDQQNLLPGDIASLAREAMEADRLCEHWLIPAGQEPGKSWSDEGFIRWRERVHASMTAHDWLDPATALRRLAELIESASTLPVQLPQQVSLRGFIERTSLERRLLRALESHGVEVEVSNNDGPATSNVECVRFADREQELWAAAVWAKEALASGARQVAVAAPDFQALRPHLARVFQQTFHPQHALELSSPDAPCYYIHGGTPLIREPLVQAAFDLLELSMGGMRRAQPFALISRWLLSPAWQDADTEMQERARLELTLRRANRYQPSLAFTADLARKHGCPTLLERVGRIPDWSDKTSASRRFFACLSHWGWPGPLALGERSRQLVEQFRNALEELEFSGPASNEDALLDLRQLCHERQIRDAGGVLSPVQVLPVEDVAGQTFDQLRVINVYGNNWPPPVRLNRLLPFSLSRALPRSDMQRQFAHFKALQRELLHAAPQVWFSRAEQLDGVKTSISPLIEALGLEELHSESIPRDLAATVWPGAGSVARTVERDLLNPVTRAPGPGTDPDLTELKAVVGVLNLQSACPWAAFLVHRLDARFPDQPAPFADAAFTGALVHRALERLYRPNLGGEKLPRHSEVPSAVDGVLDSQEARARLAPAAIEAERRRIEVLLREWLDVEQSLTLGQPRVLEQSRSATLAGFDFQVRLDRLDAVPGGSLVLDYKTGSLPKISWGEERPGELQLPLYAVLAKEDDEPPLGIGLLSLRGGEMKQAVWSGTTAISGKPVKLAGTAKEIPFTDWPATVDAWETRLVDLLREFRGGVNEFRVYRPEALRWAGLEILLRLDHEASVADETGQGVVSDEA